MTYGPRRSTRLRFHTGLEVLPASLRYADVSSINLCSLLGKCVQENHQTLRATVENPVMPATIVAAELTQLPIDLGGVREWEVRHCVTE